ncbi:MAG: GNAT family N-acetyltransferase [Nocardioidaceae bacterium]
MSPDLPPGGVRLRAYATSDADAVLALNQSHLDAVGPLDPDRLEWLLGLADACLVAEDAGELVGFAVTFAPGSAYDSVNYRWFSDRHTQFGYLDRVVVAPTHRRRGIGNQIYDAAEAAARPRGRLALEVYAEPPNVGSLAFHAARGFVEVGRLAQADGKVCAMLCKKLGDG